MNSTKIFSKAGVLCTALLLLGSLQAFCQGIKYKEVKIGDTIPEIIVKNFLSLPKKSVSLQDQYQPGLLIINFWATWCVPCLRELPRLDTIKQKFNVKFNVLSITNEDSIKVKKFFHNNPEFQFPHLQISTNDKVLGGYFPHRTVPHNVWIDKKGIVRAITDSEEITEENVQKFLSNQTIAMAVKKDNLNFDYTKPFHLADSSYLFRSLLSPYIDGISGGLVPWGRAGIGLSRYLAFNISMLDMFYDAYTRHTPYYNMDYRRVKVITKDSIRFFRPKQVFNKALKLKYARPSDWEKENAYCYDLTLPKLVPEEQFYSYVIADLERYFNVKYRIEYKKLLCNVVSLSKNGKYNIEDFKSLKDSIVYQEIFKNRITLRHSSFTEFVTKSLGTLTDQDDLWIDETGIKYPLTMSIQLDNSKPLTLDLIKPALLEYGIKITREYRPFPIMVLEDLNQ